MRRFERRRLERVRRVVITIGLSFALGALADSALTYRLGPGAAYHDGPYRPEREPASTESISSTRTDAELAALEHEVSDTPATAGTGGILANDPAVAELRSRQLLLPVDRVTRAQLHDSFSDARALGLRRHEAIDIMAPRSTPVRAVEDGTIAKLYYSKGGGGITLYQFDPTRTYSYYYAHLDRYADGIHEGQTVHRGEVLGYVGSTGNATANAPHLHFAIFRLTPERQWWKGDPINPYLVLR
jgi:murein DD-endopeptidase MepM/ murein hydrolase activator NlpD